MEESIHIPTSTFETPQALVSSGPNLSAGIERRERKRLYGKALTQQREWVHYTQGPKCQLCPSAWTEIDHVNGDPSDNRPGNTRGLCKSCNIRQRNLATGPLPDSVTNNERESLDAGLSEEIARANRLEPAYRAWLFRRTEERVPLYTQEAINGGAEFIGASPLTVRRYLEKATSPQGSYTIQSVKVANRTLKQVLPK